MREIKFRAWDKKSEQFINPNIIGISLAGTPIAPDETWLDHNLADISISQFTGLRDKNGKEIYEGDIVKSVFKSPNEILKIIWHCAGFGLASVEGKWPLTEDDAKRYIVIGNIYEK